MKQTEFIQGNRPIGARQTSAWNGCGTDLGASSFNRDKTARANADASAALPGDVGCETDAGAPATYATRQALIRNRVGSVSPTRSRHALRWFGSRTISN